MSTILHTDGKHKDIPHVEPEVKGEFVIVTADWNNEITYSLRDSALETLREGGVMEERIKSISVPGTVELVNAAALFVNRPSTVAVIILGCVIRGDTPHFDYVCNIAAEGTARLNSLGKAPVIFGVLTVETLQQAVERAGGELGNKGGEAAAAAISMANLRIICN